MPDPASVPVAASDPAPSPTADKSATSPPSFTSSLPDYRVCSCIGVLPGRACSMCGSMKWLKRCPKCMGAGFFFKTATRGPRQEPCGECRRGWKAVPLKDIPQAKLEYETWLAQQNQNEAKPPSAAAKKAKS